MQGFIDILQRLERRLLPKGLIDLANQLALFAGAYFCYQLVRGAVDGKATEAFANARRLIDIEQSLGFFVEPSVQTWTLGETWLTDFASFMYINSHFVVTVGGLAYLYLFHNHSFYFVRNMMLVAMGVALIGYGLYPTAPPRFFHEYGIVDTVEGFTGEDSVNSPVNALYNAFAAVPSMHVGFSLIIGWSLASVIRFRPLRFLWFFYPALVTWVVVVTGNHWVMDAVLGAVAAGIAWFGARQMAKLRPEAWTFRPEPATPAGLAEPGGVVGGVPNRQVTSA